MSINEENVSIQAESANTNNPTITTFNNNNTQFQAHSPIDHLVLVVHGIGKHEENWVNKLSKINILFQSVAKITNQQQNVKFVGVEWHSALHSKTDKYIEKITSPGIPVIRSMVNHTILDLLFFTSPTYSQTIYTEVGTQLNEIYDDFIKKNPTFIGKVSILAHSLGSMICYDILCNQPPERQHTSPLCGNVYHWRKSQLEKQQQNLNQSNHNPSMDNLIIDDRFLGKIDFTKLNFDVYNLYCIGSPIAVLSTIRGHTSLDIPNCVNLFNIHDPSDPVAYLIEPLIDGGFCELGESTVNLFSVKKKQVIQLTKEKEKENGTTTTTSSIFSMISNKLPQIRLGIGKNKDNTTATLTATTTTTTITSSSTNVSNNTSPLIQSSHSGITVVEKEMSLLDGANTPSKRKNSNPSTPNRSTISSPTDASESEIENDIYLMDSENTYSSSTHNNSNNNNNNSSNGSPKKKVDPSTFFGGHRFDFKLKPKGILGISEYSSVVVAHKSYWESKDVMLFIAEHLP
ncbi:DDHD domain-containing protein [Tieghemostelium lacteum]|uniref:DDHD domain-containing protein n=1 Tax=Tieghemostelium lacteum TaxID=361077 RepID=A0A151Z4F9_TIELA|nr:DDHD domain-containing protein [Tieghemostelium lacteum]|eukprot:KYQ88831.1 DDHD domain-containing protein [Tieghemostelium lacteum]